MVVWRDWDRIRVVDAERSPSNFLLDLDSTFNREKLFSLASNALRALRPNLVCLTASDFPGYPANHSNSVR